MPKSKLAENAINKGDVHILKTFKNYLHPIDDFVNFTFLIGNLGLFSIE